MAGMAGANATRKPAGPGSCRKRRGDLRTSRSGAPPGVCGRRRFANDAGSHAARADGSQPIGSGADTIDGASSGAPLPRDIFSEVELIRTTHPGRKTGRMTRASFSPRAGRRWRAEASRMRGRIGKSECLEMPPHPPRTQPSLRRLRRLACGARRPLPARGER